MSTLNVEETFLDLVGKDHLSSSLAEACRTWEWQDASLLTCHFGYAGKAPTYHSAEFDPDVNEAYIHVFGVEAAGDVETIHRSISEGSIPQGHGRAICATQFDEFHAGFGQVGGPLQTLRFEVPVPGVLIGQHWKDIHQVCQEAALETWRLYALGVPGAPISYSGVVTPEDLQLAEG